MEICPEKIPLLISKCLDGNLSVREETELNNWINASEENLALFQKLTDPQFIAEATAKMRSYDQEAALQKLLRQLPRKKTAVPAFAARVAVAATLIIVAGLGIYKSWEPGHGHEDGIVPKLQFAVLTLANGSSVPLNSEREGLIAWQGNTKVIKVKNGPLLYQSVKKEDGRGFKNSVTTRPGAKQEVIFTDGSKVLLNGNSKLDYPADFKGDDREVFLEGEAYFEIERTALKPFSLNIDSATVSTNIAELIVPQWTFFHTDSCVAYSHNHGARITLMSTKGKLYVSITNDGNIEVRAESCTAGRDHPALVIHR
jgi:transmembrane sensor